MTISDTPGAKAPPKEFVPLLKGGGPVSRFMVYVFVVIPLFALLASAVVARHGWIDWQDVLLGILFFTVTNIGVGAGFHRYFTHRSFKAKRWVRDLLAIAGSLAVEGPITGWVATHRRHHEFSDREGDPHSPWRFGTSFVQIAHGAYYAHTGWLFDEKQGTDREHYAPDLLADADPHIDWISRFFPGFVALSLLAPALLGYFLTGMSWKGALLAFFWAGLVRIAAMHHVTWSINSICHLYGEESFMAKDKSRNVRWLAILSFGESWHNLHHADPTCARHGVFRGQWDVNARFIWVLEKLHLAWDVRWPNSSRLTGKQTSNQVARNWRFGSMARKGPPARQDTT